MTKRTDGVLEGVARSISQAAVFLLDTQKTRKQVYGCLASAPPISWGQFIRNGMLTSVSTSGLVFGTYYSIYNGIGADQWHAGPCAALATSLLKIPISNSMRFMQSGYARGPISAARTLYQTKKWKGLYSGYGVSFLEDLVELDTRTRVYQQLRKHFCGLAIDEQRAIKSAVGASLGAVSGAMTAWITTPFDTVRSHMAVAKGGENGLRVAQSIIRDRGIQGLYAGAVLRASSSAIKSSLFFLCLETLQI